MECKSPLKKAINPAKLGECQPTISLRGLKWSTNLKLRLLAKIKCLAKLS